MAHLQRAPPPWLGLLRVAGALLGRRTFSLMGSEDEHDLVIRNAFIVDGSGALGYHGAHDAIQLVPLRARNAGCAE